MPFSSNLVTSTHIIVPIPANVPTEATNPNVSNKLKVTTPRGEAVYDFVLVTPAPSFNRISNEMALPGTRITFYGSNFYGIQKVIFPGNIEVTNVTVNAAATQLSLVVPAGWLAGFFSHNTNDKYCFLRIT